MAIAVTKYDTLDADQWRSAGSEQETLTFKSAGEAERKGLAHGLGGKAAYGVRIRGRGISKPDCNYRIAYMRGYKRGRELKRSNSVIVMTAKGPHSIPLSKVDDQYFDEPVGQYLIRDVSGDNRYAQILRNARRREAEGA